jgi:hypothetical protein
MVIRTGDNTVMGRIAALGKLDYLLLKRFSSDLICFLIIILNS